MLEVEGPGLFENSIAVDTERRWDAADPDPNARLKLHSQLWLENIRRRGTADWQCFLFALAALEFDFGVIPDETSLSVLAELERGDVLEWSAEEETRRAEVLEVLGRNMKDLPDYGDEEPRPRLRDL